MKETGYTEMSLGQKLYEATGNIAPWSSLDDYKKNLWNHSVEVIITDESCASGLPKAVISYTSPTTGTKTLGQIAYEVYTTSYHNYANKIISLNPPDLAFPPFKNSDIDWNSLPDEYKEAWNAAAWEISNRCTNPEVTHFPVGEGQEELTFEKELSSLINRYSMENESGTPDFILADFLRGQMSLFGATMTRRDNWFNNPSKSYITPFKNPVEVPSNIPEGL